MNWTLHNGDALAVLRELAPESVNCIVTSPPYFGLRDYGVEGQIGLEPSPDEFVSALVSVFSAARRVLAGDGVLMLNIGDSYTASSSGQRSSRIADPDSKQATNKGADIFSPHRNGVPFGLKPKDLIGIPWRVAFALQADGWWLRSDIVWHKPNPMPESIKDRPTKAHEYVFLLSKSARYFWDAAAIRERYSESTLKQFQSAYEADGRKDYDAAGVQNPSSVKSRIVAKGRDKQAQHGNRRYSGFNDRWDESVAKVADDSRNDGHRWNENDGRGFMAEAGANARTVWTIPTEPSPYEHFAVMPRALARRCIIAGCPAGGTVLDPFSGMSTTGVVALEEGRSFVGIELNPRYYAAARERLSDVAPLLATEVPE